MTPAYLLIMLGMWCYRDLPGKVDVIRAQQVPFLAITLIVTMTIFLLVLIHLASRRWNRVEAQPRSVVEAEGTG